MFRASPARGVLSARGRVSAFVLGLALTVGVAAGGSAEARTYASGADTAFTLSAQALTAPTGTDVYATVRSSDAAYPAPSIVKKVKVKGLRAGGSTDGVSNYLDVPSPGGVATVSPPDLTRGEQLEVTALVQTPETVKTIVLNTETTVKLRPDLVVTLSGPSRVVRKQPFAIEATVSEIAGDTGANAVVSLYDGTDLLARAPVTVAAAGTTPVSFTSLRIAAVKTHELVARVSDAAPAESNTANDSGTASVVVAMYDADGAVVSENLLATKVGADILRAGGNAFDAAAAVQWALNVVEPENTGLGGGVNALVHLANGQEFAIDGRETTPAAVTPTYYQSKGKYGYARNGYSAGIPGTVRTMQYMLEHWGTMTLAQTLQPAIALADDGVPVSKQLATSINNRGWMDPDAKQVFWPNGIQKREGDVLVNHDLANTFRLIAAQGPSVFYDGPIADAIVAAQRKSYDHDPVIDLGGVMTKADIAAFQVDVTTPISVDYRGYKVESVGPSTGGGVVVLEMLKMVERFQLGAAPGWGFQSTNATQVMLEAMRLGFADMNFWLGDRAYYPAIPLSGLLSDDYLAWRSSLIDPARRIKAADMLPGYAPAFGTLDQNGVEEETAQPVRETGDTSQFTIVDRWGNVVSATTTLGDGLGCTIMVPGYGFMLNDASGRNLNTAPQAGKLKSVLTPTGRIQVADPGANDAAGGKRGLGNVAPVLVEKDGEPVLATGGAGGAYIMPVVYQIVTDVLDYRMPLQDALNAPRIWGNEGTVIWNGAADPIPLFPTLVGTSPWSDVPQWFAGAPAFPQQTLNELKALGDPLASASFYPQVGGAQSIAVDPDTYALTAASDPRGLWAVGYPIVLKP